MNTDNNISKIFFIDSPEQIETEVRRISVSIYPEFNTLKLRSLLDDIKMIYKGDFPGFRESNAYYHDFNHTMCVLLATARILHGFFIFERSLSEDLYSATIIASLFHDIGYIQEEKDNKGTGAKFTKMHVDRGIEILTNYLSGKGYPEEFIKIVGSIVKFTDLNPKNKISTNDLSSEVILMGQILGSADLIAQLSDKNYLQKLPRLYREFVEGGVEGYENVDEMYEKTPAFMEVMLKRLSDDMGNVQKYARLHFKTMHGMDENLYSRFMDLNFNKIEYILNSAESNYAQVLETRA